MATREEIAELNEELFEQLNTPGMQKQAADAVNSFTRTQMREDGVFRQVLPPVTIGNSDLDRQLDTDKPYKIVDKEPGSPAAIAVGFRTQPDGLYLRGKRYPIGFQRIVTTRFQKDVDELRTWSMDIRQVVSDNIIKDMLATEDSKWFAACNLAMGGAADAQPSYNGGVVQWETINGGVTRESLQDARKIMPRGPSRLEAHTAVVNNITIKEIEKWHFGEMGGDLSEDVLKNGWTAVEFARMRWIITIKQDIVPTDSMFMFADPSFVGKHFSLEDTTMWIKRESFMLEFYAYESYGSGIGHTGGIARADFA